EQGKPVRAECDQDRDGRVDVVTTFDAAGRPVRLDHDARVDPDPFPGCVDRPEVAAYVSKIRSQVYAQWMPRERDKGASRHARLVLAADATLKTICSDDAAEHPAFAESAAKAIRRSAPFAPMDPEVAACIAGRPIRASFSLIER